MVGKSRVGTVIGINGDMTTLLLNSRIIALLLYGY